MGEARSVTDTPRGLIAVGAFLDHDDNTFVSMISHDGIMWEEYLLKDFKDLVSETLNGVTNVDSYKMKKIRRIKYFDSHDLYFVTLEGPGRSRRCYSAGN